MKLIITTIALLLSIAIFGQTLPELVETNFTTEMNLNHKASSKVDFNNIDQGLINKLISNKIRTKQLLNNPLTLITGGKQTIDTATVKAAKHHTLYQARIKRLTHTEKYDEFKTFRHRYEYYSKGEYGSLFTKGEVCTNFKVGDVTYNQLVNKIIKTYMKSKSHRAIILKNKDKFEYIGTYVVITKGGWVYNTILFP
jgi:uncharacterized protein YkwD